MARYGAWLAVPEIAPPREVASRDAIDLALEGGAWRGLAVYVLTWGPWTVFEELSGEIVYITTGELVRHFVHDA